jgi:hypothetical protein
LEAELQPLPVSLLSLVRMKLEAHHQDETCLGLLGLLPSFVLDDADEQKH